MHIRILFGYHVGEKAWIMYPFVRTRAAERQDPDFLIGPRNEKQRKKRTAVKNLYPPFQITSWHF
jgi:hypothetical protein